MTSKQSLETRRRKITEEIIEQTGITEEMIQRLVHHFYSKGREDSLLGPVFNGHISDWEAHQKKMCTFWSSVVLLTGRYHGDAGRVHMSLPIDSAHFDRWLELFRNSTRDVCPPEAASIFMDQASRVAGLLQMGIATSNGAPLFRRQRYVNTSLRKE